MPRYTGIALTPDVTLTTATIALDRLTDADLIARIVRDMVPHLEFPSSAWIPTEPDHQTLGEAIRAQIVKDLDVAYRCARDEQCDDMLAVVFVPGTTHTTLISLDHDCIHGFNNPVDRLNALGAWMRQ